ncbi:hypothetical protein AT726_12075 [Turicibacter sp. H121]|nr:hypothetical protein AT726_12075 [Turicibacter sp. H121]
MIKKMALKFISRIVDISFKDIIAKRCIQALDLGKCLNCLTLIVGLYAFPTSGRYIYVVNGRGSTLF